MAAMWARYLRLLEARPVATKSVTAAVVMAGGDFTQQAIEQQGRTLKSWDAPRACRMGMFGLCVIGPAFHTWFGILNRVVPASNGVRSALTKVLIDQSCMAPAVTTSFFVFVGTLAGQPWDYTRDKLKRDLWPTMQANWMFWPAVQAINFYAVPLNLQVLWLTGAQFCFNIYLSKQQHKDEHHTE